MEQAILDRLRQYFGHECFRPGQLRDRFGIGETMLVRTLTGSREKRVLQNGFDRLPTYGIMHGTKRTLLRDYIRALLRQGYLMMPPGDYEIIQTTKLADRVLFDGERVLWRRPAEKAELGRPQDMTAGTRKTARSETAPVDAGLFEQLRVLRTDLARQARVPAYVIFHDATLRDMAAKQPTTVEELLEVSGVGERKAERYGHAVLQVIREWKKPHGGY